MIHLSVAYQIPASVIHAEIDCAMSMINLDAKESYVLNPSGAAIWKWLQQGVSVKTILTIMANHIPIDGQDLAAQVTAFIDDLVGEGLIVQSDAPANEGSLSFTTAEDAAYAPPSVRKWYGVRLRHAAVRRVAPHNQNLLRLV